MRPVPTEVLDHIARDVIHVPASLSLPPPPLFPLIFPDNATSPRTGIMAFGHAQHRHLAVVQQYAWQHVVLSKPSHVDGILSIPATPTLPPQWDSTVRCDISLPYDSLPREVNIFLSAMRNLSTLIWSYPPLSAFSGDLRVVSSSVSTLQIRSLPCDFSPQHFVSLAWSFPNVTNVNIVEASNINFDTNFTEVSAPLWPRLSVLAAGTRTNYMPEFYVPDNLLLSLFNCFPTSSLFPSLAEACFQDNVVEVVPFLQQHALALKTWTLNAGRFDLAELLHPFNAPPSISTLVLNVSPITGDLPPLPPSVTHLVVLQPFVPVWRSLTTLRHDLDLCLARLADVCTDRIVSVRCEEREADTNGWLRSQTPFFKELPLDFKTFVFPSELLNETLADL